MHGAFAQLEFEQSARIRDQLALLREQAFGAAARRRLVLQALASGRVAAPLAHQPQRGQGQDAQQQ